MQYDALILAAGSGLRINKEFSCPKCLIKINGKSILDRQLQSFISSRKIKNIYIITGYKDYKIQKEIKKYKKKIPIKLIYNKIFYKTNNMYSTSLAEKFLKRKNFILCNGDIVVEKNFVKKLIDGKNSNEIFIDRKFFDEESMKVKILKNGRISEINKEIKNNYNSFVSADFYKFSKKASDTFFNEIKIYIKNFGIKAWTEKAIEKILKKEKFYANNINKINWYEIDNYYDYVAARNKFKNLKKKILNKYKNFIIDIDGTTFKKEEPIDGTKSFLNLIKKMNKNVYFLSNNSSLTFENFRKMFKKVKFKIKRKNVILSSDLVIRYLKKNNIKSIYTSGNHGFIKLLKKNKIKIDEINPQKIVISYDNQITYKKLKKLCELINKGIDLIATHDDQFYPSKNGPIPDAGSIIKLIEHTTGVRPKKIFGKPNIDLSYIIKDRKKTIVIGDRISKDIQFANNSNYDSALVLSGAEKNIRVKDKRFNFLLSSIKDLT